MTRWELVAADCLDAAKLLLDRGHVRSCMSRAYYSAYSTVTGRMVESGMTVSGGGRLNPGHEQLATLVKNNLRSECDEATRREIVKRLRLLLRLRVSADYDAEATLERADAVLSVQAASFIRSRLEGKA